MNPQIAIQIAAALAIFYGGWTVQGWRYEAKENERAQQVLVDQRQSAATSIRRLDNSAQAANAAVSRERNLRAAADGARSALVSLSDDTARYLRAGNASLATCTERAATLGELFLAAADAGNVLAGQADRHASDAQTCIEGWPK